MYFSKQSSMCVPGVDLLDQMIGYYGFDHRSRKWWRRIFFWGLSVSCYNSYVTARSVGGRFNHYKDWLETLVEQLVTPVTMRPPPLIPPLSPPPLSPPSPASSTSCQFAFGSPESRAASPSPSTLSRGASPSPSTSSRGASPSPSSLSRAASPAPGTSGGATAPIHDFGKVYEKRKLCKECQLVEKKDQVGTGFTVYGCVQCNIPLHMECFGKHYRRFF